MTKLIFNYDEIVRELDDGSAEITIPEEVCEKCGFNPGDTMIITVEDNKLYIRKQNGKE